MRNEDARVSLQGGRGKGTRWCAELGWAICPSIFSCPTQIWTTTDWTLRQETITLLVRFPVELGLIVMPPFWLLLWDFWKSLAAPALPLVLHTPFAFSETPPFSQPKPQKAVLFQPQHGAPPPPPNVAVLRGKEVGPDRDRVGGSVASSLRSPANRRSHSEPQGVRGVDTVQVYFPFSATSQPLTWAHSSGSDWIGGFFPPPRRGPLRLLVGAGWGRGLRPLLPRLYRGARGGTRRRRRLCFRRRRRRCRLPLRVRRGRSRRRRRRRWWRVEDRALFSLRSRCTVRWGDFFFFFNLACSDVRNVRVGARKLLPSPSPFLNFCPREGAGPVPARCAGHGGWGWWLWEAFSAFWARSNPDLGPRSSPWPPRPLPPANGIDWSGGLHRPLFPAASSAVLGALAKDPAAFLPTLAALWVCPHQNLTAAFSALF